MRNERTDKTPHVTAIFVLFQDKPERLEYQRYQR
jgi:hypothetical protein